MTREEAIDALRNLYDRCMWASQCENIGCVKCEEAINMAIESLTARPTGEWTEDEIPCDPYEPIAIVECSECGYRLGRQTWKENTFNYCPSCGARMRGGDTE